MWLSRGSMIRARADVMVVVCGALAQFALAPAVLAGPLDPLISKHAAANGVPESLVRRIIQIESRGNPNVVSKGNHGLMQIRLGTARAMGYSGTENGLLDADTNMTYAVKYLAGAYRTAGCNESRAISLYQRGYYGVAKANCGSAEPRQVARAGANALPQPPDALKPRVVQTQTITAPKLASASGRTVGKGELTAPAAPAVEQVEQSLSPTRPPPKSGAAMAAPRQVAKLEQEAIPLPAVKPEMRFDAPLNGPAPRRRTGARKKADAPINLLSFLKKFVTAEKNRASTGRKRERANDSQ